MAVFVGRTAEFAELDRQLAHARAESGSLLAIRGRRQVGKSRMLQQWVDTRALSYVFFTAQRKEPDQELAAFHHDVQASNLAAAPLSRGLTFSTWDGALELIASLATSAAPAVVVIDEFPFLMEKDASIEATLLRAWRVLESKPIVVILVGSDIGMMELVTHYQHPLFNRAKDLVVHPLNPRDTSALLGVEPGDAIAAYHIVGGFPGIVRDWQPGGDIWGFLRDQLSRENSDLIVTGERVTRAELPADVQARDVLEAIGLGERTYSQVQARTDVQAKTLSKSLKMLTDDKRLVSTRQPYSTRKASEPRYSISDTYLRFWLRFIRTGQDEVARGQGHLVFDRIRAQWDTYLGRAVEPLVREAVMRLATKDPDRFFGATHVGGWWNRTSSVEVDLVGGDRPDVAKNLAFVGSIKWGPAGFSDDDLRDLATQRDAVPGSTANTKLVAVAAGPLVGAPDLALTPKDLLEAWE